MIIQAIALLDDLDKELNIYAMRVKEWYGWHFPEMARIVNDNLAYARIILAMGMRTGAAMADLAEILPEEIELAVKAAAEVSMGTEITSEDLKNIQGLAEQVVSFTEQRATLSSYLLARMKAVAPNLTALVGDLVGARLISHAGSLTNLAKSPASTIQILGAEKALFRALKTKHDTPKYGLIYHASLIGQATGKNKGKIARMLANKAALGLRVDARSDWSQEGEGKGDMVPEEERSALGVDHRLLIERRLASLEGKPIKSKGVAIAPNGVSMQPGKWEVKEARKYNPDADGLAGDEPAAIMPASKKARKDKPNGLTQLIQEVNPDTEPERSKVEIADGQDAEEEESSDEEMESDAKAGTSDSPGKEPTPKEEPAAVAPLSKDRREDPIEDRRSETISTVSEDSPDSPPSPTQQERNWQSSILGNTKVAKKARKKERHERKLALSEARSEERKKRRAKIARRLDRKERRLKRAEQIERREAREDTALKELAEQTGLSIARYKRKLERGEIKFDAEGKPSAISKKDVKKAKKMAEEAERKAKVVDVANGNVEESRKKRKRDTDDADVKEKSERKKKRKSKA